MKLTSYTARRDRLLEDFAVSFWLKDAVRALDKRDPLDAESDAAVLAALARARLDEALKLGMRV